MIHLQRMDLRECSVNHQVAKAKISAWTKVCEPLLKLFVHKAAIMCSSITEDCAT